MCGLFAHNYNDKNLSEETNKILFHRGPDFNNYINIKKFTIGHNLLSIRGSIELSKQPKITKSGRYIFAFNGQIYNTSEICNKFGLNFHNNIDTLILSDLIELKGKNFISHIDGMFSIILFDKKKNEVHAYRDNSGQKPLYYYNNNGKYFICSEIKPILNCIKKYEKVETDELGITEILTYGYNTSTSTIFKNIKKVLPGQKVKIDINGKFNFNNFSPNFIANKNSLEAIIEENIKKHLQTEQKIGINLSGGFDSNIILYESLKYRPNISVFSTKFETKNEKYNLDFNAAKQIASSYQIPFYETVVTKNDYIENFIKSFQAIEEPNFNINNPAYYLNYKNQNKNGFRSILSGDGGDEIFVGYDWYFNYKRYESIFALFSKILKNKKLYLEVFNFFREFKRYNFYISNKSFVNNAIYYKNIFSNFLSISNNFKNYLVSNFSNIPSLDWDKKKLLLQQYFWLNGEILLRADKLAMANSLEARSPFCDYNFRQNLLLNLNKNDFSGKMNKLRIRQLYKNKLHPVVVGNKAKLGWTIPNEWKIEKKLTDSIIDIMPNQDDNYIKWSKIKDSMKLNNNFISQKNMNGIISLAILKKKNFMSF